MGRRNKRGYREQKPKVRRLPPPSEMKLGEDVIEGRRQYEEDDDYPVQCADCGNWFSSSDLDDGLCYQCVKESQIDYGEED